MQFLTGTIGGSMSLSFERRRANLKQPHRSSTWSMYCSVNSEITKVSVETWNRQMESSTQDFNRPTKILWNLFLVGALAIKFPDMEDVGTFRVGTSYSTVQSLLAQPLTGDISYIEQHPVSWNVHLFKHKYH